MAVAVAYDAEVVDTAEVAVEQYAVAKGEKLPGIIPAQLADTLGGVGLGIGVFLYVVEFVYLGSPHEVAERAYTLLKGRERAQLGLGQFDNARLPEFVLHLENTGAVPFVLNMVKRFEYEIGEPGRLVVAVESEIAVVAYGEIVLAQKLDVALPFILRRCSGFLPRLPFGTGQRVAPQLHLAVHLGKLLDAGIEHERVLDVAQKLRYLGHALALLHEGVGGGEAFLREPYDKGLFLNRGIDLFGEDIAVGVLFADGGYLPPPLKVAYAVGFEGFDFKIEQRHIHVAEVGR